MVLVIRLHASAFIGGALFLLTISLPGVDWRTYKPSLHSQVAPLGLVEGRSLLGGFCESVTGTKGSGLTCKTRSLGSAFADIFENRFHPKGVIFGHFLDTPVESAVITGFSLETHPAHWGGTLFLTKENGSWKPAWYKSGLITDSCEKAERPDGREILICEYEDGGMGHRIHTLFAIDLRETLPPESPLVLVDSFESDFCMGQRQVMERVQWGSSRQRFSVIVRTPEWEILPDGACGPQPPKRPPLSTRLEFDVTNDGVQSR